MDKKINRRKSKKKAQSVIKIVENNNDDHYLEEFISDGNTGATKEAYKVSKK